MSSESRRLTPLATTIASISGRMMVYSPVSSKTMITAVIGARADAGEDGAHPDQRVGAGRRGQSRAGRLWASWPKPEPSIAPMNSDGAKTPPEPPMAIVRLVATILATSNINTNATT